MDTGQDPDRIETFITRWEASDANERANAPFTLTGSYDYSAKRDYSPAFHFPKEGMK